MKLILISILLLMLEGCFYGDVDKVHWHGPGKAEYQKYDNFGRGGETKYFKSRTLIHPE